MRSKFFNRPARCSENVLHQSTLESRRCTELHLMQKGGLISGLIAHPQKRFELEVNGKHVTTYVADFCYYDNERRVTVVEDCKGFTTEVFRLKAKLMSACLGIDVEVVRRVKKGGPRVAVGGKRQEHRALWRTCPCGHRWPVLQYDKDDERCPACRLGAPLAVVGSSRPKDAAKGE